MPFSSLEPLVTAMLRGTVRKHGIARHRDRDPGQAWRTPTFGLYRDVLPVLLRAYSLGAGTYTGIEAV